MRAQGSCSAHQWRVPDQLQHVVRDFWPLGHYRSRIRSEIDIEEEFERLYRPATLRRKQNCKARPLMNWLEEIVRGAN